MTEEEWLGANDPHPMLALVETSASERKLRLFASACARAWSGQPSPDVQKAIEVGEGLADGIASDDSL